MRNLLTICFLGILLAACLDDEEFASATVAVYQYGPNQCFPNSDEALRQNALRLQGAGIEVTHSRCGMTTNLAYPTVVQCGVPNGSIWVHDIPVGQLPVAKDNGFDSADELPEDPQTGRGWVETDCR